MPEGFNHIHGSDDVSSAELAACETLRIALDRSWSAMMLYEDRHAARTRAMSECELALRACPGESVRLRVSAEGWGIGGGTEVGAARAASGELPRLLFAMDLVAIELSTSLDAAAIERVLGVVFRARAESLRGSALTGELRASVGDRASLLPVHSGVLTLVEGTIERNGHGAGARTIEPGTWTEFVDAMLDAQTSPDSTNGSSGGALAALLAGATSHTTLTRDMAEVGHRLAELPRNEREAASERIARWVATLSPETRDSLLAMKDGTAEGTGKLLHALAGRLPIDQIVSALELSSGSAVSLNSRHNLLLFSKLSSLAMDQSVDLQKRVIAAIEQVGDREGGGASHGSAAIGMVGDLLRPVHADDFTPEDYRERLQSLASVMLRTASSVKDPEELATNALGARIAEIGEHILNTTRHTPTPGFFSHVQRSIVPALVAGRLDLYLSWGRLTTVDAGPASRTLNDHLCSRPVLHAALALAARQPSERDRLLALLTAWNPRSARLVMEFVEGAQNAPTTAENDWIHLLDRWLAGATNDCTCGDFVQAVERGKLSTEAMIAMLARASADTREGVLAKVVHHHVRAVRRRGYALCEALEGRWSGERLREAILDSDGEIAALGQSRLARDVSPDDLCAMLRTLSLTVSRDEARLARALVRVLESIPGNDEVKRALRVWRFSPARVRAGLLRDTTMSDEKGAAA